jgi:hypothetical protein
MVNASTLIKIGTVICGAMFFMGVRATYSSDPEGLVISGPEAAIKAGLFESDQSGMFLWPNVHKFCSYLESMTGPTNNPEVQLLFSNDEQTAFYEGSCGDRCSIAEESRNIRECQKVLNGQQCKLYAAINKNVIYDLTVSADGKGLAETCNSQRN